MNTGRTGDPMTELKEEAEKEKQTTVVSVPISVVVAVPLEIDVSIPEEMKHDSDMEGYKTVDPTECDEAVNAAIEAYQASDACGRILNALLSAAIRSKEKYPDVEISITPFAGLVEETKL
jgi:hypothetical protein